MRTSSYQAWDRALDGRLGEILVELHDSGLSYDLIVDRLRDEHRLEVSRTTVGRWLVIAKAETAPEAAAS